MRSLYKDLHGSLCWNDGNVSNVQHGTDGLTTFTVRYKWCRLSQWYSYDAFVVLNPVTGQYLEERV